VRRKWLRRGGPHSAIGSAARGTAPRVSRATAVVTAIAKWIGSVLEGSFATIVNARAVSFDPATGNTATITFAATSQRHVRVVITGNTGWPAGQLASLEVYGK
jgi:hypothetical protein